MSTLITATWAEDPGRMLLTKGIVKNMCRSQNDRLAGGVEPPWGSTASALEFGTLALGKGYFDDKDTMGAVGATCAPKNRSNIKDLVQRHWLMEIYVNA